MDQWSESDLSMAAWCRKENINIHQMYYWKRKFDQQTDNPSSSDWLEISHSDNIDDYSSIIINSLLSSKQIMGKGATDLTHFYF
ncbi:hypothetical protein Pryu01_02888 [Paraliobacillus ryukyuensis]|uniref:Transposase n=2 Tax=Paraliobacillus ryukyuensis TaxID=200904 RepID=A0A366E1L6_9BACI|nr:hypothetical protein [Paraliobacillus ryukyuensis]RBO95394.1 hypothetical protein DES48_108105 [Paraliobacillus ryukyuensis]